MLIARDNLASMLSPTSLLKEEAPSDVPLFAVNVGIDKAVVGLFRLVRLPP